MPEAASTRFALVGPSITDLVSQGDDIMRAMIVRLEAVGAKYGVGTDVAKGAAAAANAGTFYIATDTGPSLYFSTGSAWVKGAVSPVPTADIADAAVTSRKVAPTIVTVEQQGLSTAMTLSEADLAASVLNLTPLVVSTVIVEAYIRFSIPSGNITPFFRIRQDAANDAASFLTTNNAGFTHVQSVHGFATFTSVSAAAHTYRLRVGGSGSTVIQEFRIRAIAYAQ